MGQALYSINFRVGCYSKTSKCGQDCRALSSLHTASRQTLRKPSAVWKGLQTASNVARHDFLFKAKFHDTTLVSDIIIFFCASGLMLTWYPPSYMFRWHVIKDLDWGTASQHSDHWEVSSDGKPPYALFYCGAKYRGRFARYCPNFLCLLFTFGSRPVPREIALQVFWSLTISSTCVYVKTCTQCRSFCR